MALHTSWIAFEASVGTLDSQRAAELRCAAHMQAVTRRDAKITAAEQEAAAVSAAHAEYTRESRCIQIRMLV